MPAEEAKRQRHEKISQARRRRWLRVLVVGIIVGCLVAAAAIVYNSKLFSVRRIEVHGTRELTRSQVIRSSGVKLGDNIFDVDEEAARKRLLKNAWLESVSVSRQLPAIVRINVRERTPVAGLFRPEATYLIDATGFVLARRGALTDVGLPLVRDIDVGKVSVGTRLRSKALSDALKALLSLSPKLRKTVDAISAPAADKLVFFTKEGLEIDYGSATDMAAKNEVINRVLRQESGKVLTIDVRVVTNPTSKPRIQKLGGAPADQ